MWNLITGLVSAAKEFFHWRRVQTEIQARRLILDEIERATDEIDDLEDKVERARRTGVPQLADRLLRRATRLVLYRSGLPDLGGGADLHSPAEDHPSDAERGPGEGPANPGSSQVGG